MDSKEVKAKINDGANRVENGVASMADSLGNGVDAIGEQAQRMNDTLRDLGQRLLDSTKALSEEATKQAKQRPLMVFGAAFIAGLIVARSLRR